MRSVYLTSFPFTQKVRAQGIERSRCAIGEGKKGGAIPHLYTKLGPASQWLFAGLSPWPLVGSVGWEAAYKVILRISLGIDEEKSLLFQCFVEKHHLPQQTRNTYTL